MKINKNSTICLLAAVAMVLLFQNCSKGVVYHQDLGSKGDPDFCKKNPKDPQCQVKPKACSLPGVEVAHGAEVEAFFSETVDFRSACHSEMRTCTDGVLSGTAGYTSCVVLPPKFDLSMSQISTLNHRARPEIETEYGELGGWSPHLRGHMKMNDDSLWYVVDKQSTTCNYFANYCWMETNQYYKKATDGTWQLMAEQQNLASIKQKLASVSDGEKIYSYGAVTEDPFSLQECYLNTGDVNDKACAAVQIGGTDLQLTANSNYVGAAINATGAKVVWWTTVGLDNNPGNFSYIWKQGNDAWNGPFTTDLDPYNDIGYIHASFVSPNGLVFNGQFFQGDYADPDSFSYFAAWGALVLGEPANFQAYPAAGVLEPQTSSDIWVDRQSGAIHSIVRVDLTNVYYYQAKAGDVPVAQFNFPNSYRIRFQYSRASGQLYLAVGEGYEVKVYRFDQDLSQPLSLVSAEVKTAILPVLAFGQVTGIYNGSPIYSSANVDEKVNFALCGSYQLHDNEIWELLITE